MNESNDCSDVLNALKNCPKGQLIYDKHWKEERRTQDIMNDIKIKTSSLTISPKTQTNSNAIKTKSCAKYKVIESSIKETTESTNDNINEDNKNKQQMKTLRHRINDSTNDLDLILYEKQRQEIIVKNIDKKRESLENEFKKCDEEYEESLKISRQKFALKAAKRLDEFAEDYKALHESILTKQNYFEDKSMNTNSKLKEIESQHKLLVEEQLKKQNIKRKSLLGIRNEMDFLLKTSIQLYNNLGNEEKSDQLLHTLKQDVNLMIGLLQNIDILINEPDLNDSNMTNAQNLKLEMIGLKEKIENYIKQRKEKSFQNSNQPIIDNKVVNNSIPSKSNSITKFVDSNAFKDYLKLQKFSNDFENNFKHFVNENSFKQKRNDLQLFVKTTINTISSLSVDHIRDKLNRLTQLFNEKNVEYSGKQIKCNSKDGSLAFSMSLASKMFISVCAKQKALTLAPIIVLLWSRFPIFGQIFMAQMQDKCPYLVPYYPQKDSETNELEYLIASGYHISKDGTQESDETFLNRMRAMVKLYAAIIQSNLESGHPHGMKSGWIWVSRVLNSEPRPVITAAILEAFLSITSHKFYRFYGKQFVKIIDFIQNDYIKRMESVSQKETKRQSLVKLQMFVENLKTKIVRRVSLTEIIPEGVIPDYFFMASYSHSRGTTFNN